AKIVTKEAANAVKVSETDSLFQVTVNNLRVSFSKRTGILREVKNDKGVIPFNNGPILQEGENNFAGFSYRMEGKNVVIESKFDRKESYNMLQWTIYPSGWVKM